MMCINTYCHSRERMCWEYPSYILSVIHSWLQDVSPEKTYIPRSSIQTMCMVFIISFIYEETKSKGRHKDIRKKNIFLLSLICRFVLNWCNRSYENKPTMNVHRISVFLTDFRGQEPVVDFMICTGWFFPDISRYLMVYFFVSDISRYLMTYFFSTDTKQSSRTATSLYQALCRTNIAIWLFPTTRSSPKTTSFLFLSVYLQRFGRDRCVFGSRKQTVWKQQNVFIEAKVNFSAYVSPAVKILLCTSCPFWWHIQFSEKYVMKENGYVVNRINFQVQQGYSYK